MSEQLHEEQVIKQLREMVADMKQKLVERSMLLANILPHIEQACKQGDGVEYYIAQEFCERFTQQIYKFKEEYQHEVKKG